MKAHVVSGARADFRPPRSSALEVFLAPTTVAVVGASQEPHSVGRAVMANLLRSPFGGTLFPINPDCSGILGVKAYPCLAAVPLRVELAVVATPAPAVPGVLAECAAAGVKGALILSAGFRAGDPTRAELERQFRDQVRPEGMRVLGPGSIGVVCTRTGFNATFAPALPPAGSVGYISQCGSLLTALTSGGVPEAVGCSTFLSVGSMLDVGWAECLEYLAEDPQTERVGIYLESLGDAPSFFAAVRRVTPHKPIIVVRGGRAAAGDDFLEEAFRRAGVLCVRTLGDLFCMAELLATQPAPRGRRLLIVSNGGGPAAVAADALAAEGGELASLAPATAAALAALLPAARGPENPIDVGEDAGIEPYARAVVAAARDPGSAGLLLMLTPHATLDPARVIEEVVARADLKGKLVLASWLWGAANPASLAALSQAGIPAFSCPAAAVRAFASLCRHADNLRDLAQASAPPPAFREPAPDRALAAHLVQVARRAGRTTLTKAESRQLLKAYRLPLLEPCTAASEAEAVVLADAAGYPVVLRLLPAGAPAGSELEGLSAHASDPAAVRRAYRTLEWVVRGRGGAPLTGVQVRPVASPGHQELALESFPHPQLGPVMRLSAAAAGAVFPGGAIALPPLSTPLVRQLIEQASLFTTRGKLHRDEWVDLAALEQLLIAFSQLVVEGRWIKDISLQPLLASPERLLILDAAVTLQGPDVREEHLPRPALVVPGRWKGTGPHAPRALAR